jgi:hyaluronan synthase
VSHALTSLSGRTVLYRGVVLKEVVEEMLNETFLGKLCISGEDKCLTRLIQERGWKVKYQANACIQTVGAANLGTYLKQNIRWARNSWRSDLKTIFSRWVWKREKLFALHLVDRFIQPFTLFLGPVYFVLSLMWGHWLVAVMLFFWFHVSRAIKIYPHLRHNPSEILMLPMYVAIQYALGALKIYAFVTMNQQGWVTRSKKETMVTNKPVTS